MPALWPDSARIDESGELWLGGCAASALAEQHGTPLYVFDESTLRGRARAYLAALRRHYPGRAAVAYASKAYLSLAMARLFAEEGLDLDVVSGGELYVALQAGFPPGRIHFHGNNKSATELQEALAAGVGRIVVDNFHELALLSERAASAARPVPIWLRLAPGVQAHTHAHIQTGQEDTKFGFSIANGDAERAVAGALATPGLSLVGLHAHIGSQIYETEALSSAAGRLLAFAATLRDRHGLALQELSPGGGWGVPMTGTDPEAPIDTYVEAVAGAVVAACRQYGLDLPHLVLEPGRSLVAGAAVALYRAGARKEIPGVRTYVAVDGGMADNIRPALYGARYSARAIPAHPSGSEPPLMETITVAGKFCESGDILIRDITLPRLAPGDLLAIPMAGAYTLSMASNYNLAARPAVVLVNDGASRLIQRRERYPDLIARDLPLHAGGASAAERPEAALPRPFHKYQALGNDYIVLDPAAWPYPPDARTVQRLCDRHTGVGADGILWGPGPADNSAAGFAVRMFNPDGSEFEKSGNGLRIFARYLWDRRLPENPDFVIHSAGGPVTAHVLDARGAHIAVDMGVLTFDGGAIPLAGPPREVVDEPFTLEGYTFRMTALGIGNPHCVLFLEGTAAGPQPPESGMGAGTQPVNLPATLAQRLGPQVERLPLFPRRANVQFVQVIDEHTLRIEIWERGAGYTLASGTSSCAAAGAAIRTGRCASPVTVHMPGGSMEVEIDAGWNVRLTGVVAPVCRGEISPGLLSEDQ